MKNLLVNKQKKSLYGGLYGSSPSYYIKKFSNKFKSVIVIVDNNTEINNLANEFTLFKDKKLKISKFLDFEHLPYENTISDNNINGERLNTFANLLKLIIP